MKREAWPREVETALGGKICETQPVAGGDVGDSYRVELDSSQTLFVKVYADAPPSLAATEAQGLEWLAAAEAIRIARPLAVGPRWLALEWIASSPRAPDFNLRLGHGLAALHERGAESFGFPNDNWIARLPQSGRAHTDWGSFYANERIDPLTRKATQQGLLSPALTRTLEALSESLAHRAAGSVRPARLHGDLWSGNVMSDERGHPCLVDPSVYAGHNEVDLAMMRLFGGFDDEVFDAYASVRPLDAGFEERVALYQVYPLLVHVCLFGTAYCGQLEEVLHRAL